MKKLLAVMALVLAACGQGGSSLTVTDAQYRPPLGVTGVMLIENCPWPSISAT